MSHNPELSLQDVIRLRHSVRAYEPRQLPRQTVEAVLASAFFAPKAQPDSLALAVVQDPALLDRLSEEAKAFALALGVPHLAALGESEAFHCFYQAPTVLLVCAREDAVAGESDCAAAIQNMLLTATSLGLGSCWIYFGVMAFSGAAGPELARLCKLPQGYAPKACVALGYEAGVAHSPPPRDGEAHFLASIPWIQAQE